MANYTTADLRNLALVGHAGSGKTTLAERMLLATGVIGRMGTVEDGNTVCDFEAEEKHHQHSLNSAVVHFDHESKRINLIDTPGYPDFVGQSIAVLDAVETAVVVIDATRGIENVTRRMMKRANEEGLARAVVVNKIDNAAGKLGELVEQIRETFGREVLPINLPAEGGTKVVRCFYKTDGATDFSSVEEANQALVDQVVEVDDALMEKYLESGSISAEDLESTFTRAMNEGHLVPMFFVSGKEGTGVDELLDIIAKLFPSPVSGPKKTFLSAGDGDDLNEWNAEPDPEKPVVGHVFRVATDPFVGKLAAFRIFQGKLKAGDSVYIGDARKPVRLAHLFQLQGKDHVEVHEVVPGDIVAVAKIDEMEYGEVVHANDSVKSARLKSQPPIKPMYGLAVTAAKRGEEGKISQALNRLAEEDPSLEVERDQTTHEMVIRGIGELHLRVLIERLKSRFHLEVQTAPPKIAYRETISAKAEGHHRHKKQTGGAGQFGEVFMRVEPLPQDAEDDLEFVDDTFGGSIPKQFLPAIEKGVKMVMQQGAIAGYPLQKIKVSVYDGKYHPVDSKEVAFVTAGKKAFVDAIQKARPQILEPFVHLEITAPSDYMGDITSDLAGRRGRVQGTDILPGGLALITASAPLSEVSTYASALKGMTQGTGSYAMEYSHYEPTPGNVQQEIVAQYKPREEED
ncbi:MAG: elongation factor G [Phycisphaerales bacterium]